MGNSKRFNRMAIIIVTIATGLAFIGLAVYGLSFPVNEIISQLILVGILLIILLVLAAITAWCIRQIINVIERRRQKQEDDEKTDELDLNS